MTELNMKIEGMSCGHCVMRVKKAVSALPGVADSEVEVGSAKVRFDETKLKREQIERAVKDAGYQVVG